MSTTAVTAASALQPATTRRLPWSRVIGYGCGDAGCNISFQMTGLFLLIYYTDVVGLTAGEAAGIVGFVKFWDAFADIFAGRMVDRTMTRWGKFRPFVLWFSLPLLLINLLCFAVPDFSSHGARIAWGYVTTRSWARSTRSSTFRSARWLER